MNKYFLPAQIIFTPDQELTDCAIEVEGEKISNILSNNQIPLNAQTITTFEKNFIITPGLIDLHTHGAGGADTMDSNIESLNTMSRFFTKHGVTSFYATTVAASTKEITRVLESVQRQAYSIEGANLAGIHLEGPFLNEAYKGAQSQKFLRRASPDEYQGWIDSGIVKLITLAPEIPGCEKLIEYGRNHGVEFAIGHSGASFEQVLQAADFGVRQSTHTFNGMGKLDHREPGTIGGILCDERIFTQIIADGTHVHPSVAGLLVKIKGISKTILVTDSISATGCSDGDYFLGDLPIHVKNGIARTDTGSLAGSTLTLDQAIINMMKFANLSFQNCLTMATKTPAEAMNISSSKGVIKPGADADLTIFDTDLKVGATIVKGKFVFNANNKKG